MNHSKLSISILVAGFASVVGCGSLSEKTESSSSAKSSSAPGGSSKPAAAAVSNTKDVSLDPLPLKITLPATEAGTTMDKTLDGKKSVGVSYDALSAGLNVSESTEKNFDAVKKQWQGDTVMFPFKRWVKQDAKTAVEEFSIDGKSGFVALSWREVGGKPYLCQSAGLSGLKTAEDADTVLKVCETLAAK